MDNIANINKILATKRVAVVGAGGLGGYAIELLGRLPLLELKIIDGDSFSKTNLNRQIYCTKDTLGVKKALVGSEKIQNIGIVCTVNAICTNITMINYYDHLAGMDIIIDCVDNVETRLVLQEACNKLMIPIVHGAINGLCGHVTTVMPNTNMLGEIYKTGMRKTEETISFSPCLIASLQVSECIKMLTNNANNLVNKLLIVDLETNEFNIMSL